MENTRSTLWVTSLKRRKASSCWVVYVKEIGLDNFYRYFYHKNVEKCFQLSFRSFFSIWVFFHEHSRITGLQRNGKGISLNPHYHFHPLHRHLNISWTFTSAHSWQPDWNRETLVSECKSLTTKLCTLEKFWRKKKVVLELKVFLVGRWEIFF